MTLVYTPNIEEHGFHVRMQKELSFYTERIVNDDGFIFERLIENPYFLISDIWNVDFIGSIQNFKHQYDKYKYPNKNLYFSINSRSVNLELKYVFYKKLFNNDWALTSIIAAQGQSLRKLTKFLNEKHPFLRSLLDLHMEETEKEWILWLERHGINTHRYRNYKIYGTIKEKTNYSTFFKKIYNSLYSLTDTREEWEKDRWDVRVLNQKYGIAYNLSIVDYFVDFSKIENHHIRKEIKKYMKERLLGKQNFSWGTVQQYMKILPNFINYVLSIQPTWNDLKELKRVHVLKYIEWLHKYAKNNLKRKDANPERYIARSLICVQKFLEDIQRFEYNISPETHIRLLIFPTDKPKQKKKAYDHIEYIPDYVLAQLFDNIKYLHPEVQPIVWVAFKTGLRISDVLGLTQDCLVKLNEKYQLVTDIEKTYIQGHSIPIDEELAKVLAVLINNSKKHSNQDNNLQKFIFIRYRGSRKGKPFSQNWVQQKLNILARERNIKNENGDIFHFKLHQFRHTYAVKMLNSGADILTVQELLAHASPEMTIRYARLLDQTKRIAFENAVKQGVFSFDLNGKMYDVSETDEVPHDILEMMWRDHKLTAIDNPYGSCRARLNGNCPYAEEPPCLTCNGGKPCKDLAVGLSEMDVAKYEIHIQSTSKMINVAKQYGREEIVEKNQKNLERLQDIYNTIKQGNIIFGRLDRVQKKQGVLNV